MENERQAIKKFNNWRKRSAKGIPLLTQRVFALRDKAYAGHGFHWGLEKELGLCIFHLNNYDESYRDLGIQISVEVLLESLYKHIVEIEKSLI